MSASSKKKLRKEQNASQLTERQLNELKEAKKLQNYTRIFVVVIAAVLCAALIIMGVTAFTNSGILERNNDAITIGNHTLTAAQFNFHYVDAVQSKYSEWYQEYDSDYADLMISINKRLDTTAPLDEQPHPEVEGKTYADYFADIALEKAKETYALCDAAKAAGVELSAEDIENIDNSVANMDFWAMYTGYGNTKQYLKALYGKGATEKLYREYLETTTLASSYEESHLDGLKYEQADIDAHSKENFDNFSTFSYISFPVLAHDFVEHGEDNSHDHSDEDNAKALTEAKKIADELVASGAATLEDLNKAIAEIEVYKTKNATESKNVLYTNILNEEIAKWLAASDRKAGDLSVIPYTSTTTDADGKETTENNGYYVVMFNGRNDNEDKMVDVRHILVKFTGGTTEDGETVYSDAEKKTAKDKIDAILKTWEEGEKTEESFKTLATSKTEDTGSKSNGGLYEKVYPGQMVDNFNDWCFADGRKAGDYGIVETEYGYHLIYFVKQGEQTYRDSMIETKLRNDAHEEWFNGLVDAITASELDSTYVSTDMIIGG